MLQIMFQVGLMPKHFRRSLQYSESALLVKVCLYKYMAIRGGLLYRDCF